MDAEAYPNCEFASYLTMPKKGSSRRCAACPDWVISRHNGSFCVTSVGPPISKRRGNVGCPKKCHTRTLKTRAGPSLLPSDGKDWGVGPRPSPIQVTDHNCTLPVKMAGLGGRAFLGGIAPRHGLLLSSLRRLPLHCGSAVPTKPTAASLLVPTKADPPANRSKNARGAAHCVVLNIIMSPLDVAQDHLGARGDLGLCAWTRAVAVATNGAKFGGPHS